MSVTVVPYSSEWPTQFAQVAATLRGALVNVRIVSIEHVGSTSVPGLAAKPVIDIDVVVSRAQLRPAIDALAAVGYTHRGDLGVHDRQSLAAPDADPKRNVYVCVEGTLHLRNHLAVRDILRARPDLRDRYGSTKTRLANDPTMEIPRYLALKSPILQEILALSDLTDLEKQTIFDLNTGFDKGQPDRSAPAS